ncbi:MAG: CHAT domain-containing protein [Cyanobacteriota bacterium]
MIKKLLSLVLLLCMLIFVPLSFAQTEEDEYFYLPQERQLMDNAQYLEARELFEKALLKAEADKDLRNEAKYIKCIGDTYLRLSDTNKALEKYLNAKELLGSSDDKKLERSILHAIGLVYATQYEYDKAEEFYSKALEISKSIDYAYGIISGYNNIGNLYVSQANYVTALENLEKAYEAAKKTRIQEYELSVLSNLANIYSYKNENDRAIESYKKIIEISKNYQDQTLYADTLNNIATIYITLEDIDKAIENLDKAAEIYKKLNNKKQLSKTYLNLGISTIKQAEFKSSLIEKYETLDLAMKYFGSAFDIAVETNSIDTALAAYDQLLSLRNGLVRTCVDLQNLQDQLSLDLRQLESTLKSNNKETEVVNQLKLIAEEDTFCKKLNSQEEMEKLIKIRMALIEVAEDHKFNQFLSGLYNGIANDYRQLNLYDKSVEFYEKAAALKESIYNQNMWIIYYNLADNYNKLGNKEKALEYYDKAIEEVKKISGFISLKTDKNLYIRTKQELFKEAADLKLESGDAVGARDLIEFAKISEQSDYLTAHFLNKPENKVNEKLIDLKKINEIKSETSNINEKLSQELSKPEEGQNTEAVKDLKEQLQQKRLEFQKMALNIQQENPDLLQYVAIKPTNIRTIQTRLPEDTVLIEPVIFEDKIMIFVGPPGNNPPVYKVVKLAPEDKIVSYLISFRKAIYAKDYNVFLEKSSKLYDLLIRPIENDIKDYKVLVISPYENLRYIPFQALYDGKNFLAEKYAVVNATSSTGLKIAGQQTDDIVSLLAFGNATEDLPEAEEEVQAIAENFNNPKVYLREKASKSAFEEEIDNNYKIIHLATHGLLNNDDPDDSKLLFSGKGAENQLSIGDIMAYDFSDKDLVVLSACDSAIGKTKGAEVSALASAFELAAAPSVIASLWKVSDKSTSILMEGFYKNLVSGKTKAESLKEAQIQLLKSDKFSNPYFWAPFILMGEWK